MLAMEYALQYPEHLAGLVVSNMTASVAEYVKNAAVLVSQLPPAAQAVIARHRAKADYEAPECQKVLMEEVYSRHVCRLNPMRSPAGATSPG
jgi:proline iminopeptidase